MSAFSLWRAKAAPLILLCALLLVCLSADGTASHATAPVIESPGAPPSKSKWRSRSAPVNTSSAPPSGRSQPHSQQQQQQQQQHQQHQQQQQQQQHQQQQQQQQQQQHGEQQSSEQQTAPSKHLDGQSTTKFVAECLMPTALGRFRMRSYTHSSDDVPVSGNRLEPIVVIHGDVTGAEDVVVRVHDQCFTSEVFGSRRCDCREQLHESLKLIRRETGVVIYLQQEGRGIGVSNKVAAYSLQDAGMDTVDANIHLGFKDELREYSTVPAILADLGIKSIKLVTNNPFKIEQLTRLGVKITGRVTLEIPANEHNIAYIRSKRDKMNHIYPADLSSSASSSAEAFDAFFRATASSVAASLPTGGDEDSASSAVAEDAKAAEVEATPPLGYLAQLPADQLERHHRGYAFGRQSVEDALAAIRDGRIVAVVDDENRENEGDLIMAAEKATPETIGFIVRHTSGVLCAGMQSPRLESLALPPMVTNNEDPKQTAYTVSVDCRHGTTTGISASDRAITFRALADRNFKPTDFQRPGHVFPLRYRQGGVLVRAGHTEASVDLPRLAGMYPAGVLAELVNDDGSIMRLPTIKAFSAEHGLVLTSVQDIIAYRLETEERPQSSP